MGVHVIDQKFGYLPNKIFNEGFDIYVEALVKAQDGYGIVYNQHLVTVWDVREAEIFCDRLNQNFERMYYVPKWCAQIMKKYEKG